MVMVDLGIPPGFDLLSEDLQAYQEKSAGGKSGRLEKFRLRAKYPIRAKTFQSRVYEYYDPEVSSMTRPIQLEVRAK